MSLYGEQVKEMIEADPSVSLLVDPYKLEEMDQQTAGSIYRMVIGGGAKPLFEALQHNDMLKEG